MAPTSSCNIPKSYLRVHARGSFARSGSNEFPIYSLEMDVTWKIHEAEPEYDYPQANAYSKADANCNYCPFRQL